MDYIARVVHRLGAEIRGAGASLANWLFAPRWSLSPWWPGEGRAARQTTLLQLLAAGVEQRANLGALVAALADEHTWLYRRRLNQLAQRLRGGMPLADAVEQTPGVLADAGVLAARFGEESGTLALSLNEFAWRDRTAAHSVRRRIRATRLYAIAMILAIAAIVTYLLLQIAPAYMQIFDDFELEPSRVFHALVHVGHAVSNTALPVLLLAAVGAVWLMATRNERWRRFLATTAARLVRPAASLQASDLWSYLASAAAAGRPLAGAVSTLARYHYDPAIRRKLLFVRNEIDHGADLYESMADVRLASAPEVAALHNAPADEGPAWTLRQLAAARRERVFARVHNALDFLFPVVVVVIGAVVLFVVAAMLLPMTQISEGLSG